jgi:WD40 repeat protein
MVMSVSFSRDDDVLATGVVMGKACLYDLEAAEIKVEIAVCKGPIFCVLLKTLDDEPVLVTGDVTGQVVIWDYETQERLKAFDCGCPVRGLDMSSEGDTIATGNAKGDACIWDVRSGMCLKTMACGGMVYSVDLSGDKKLLATGDQHQRAKVWNVATGAVVHNLPCGEVVKRVDLSGDSSMLATGAGDACKIWDLVSGTLIHSKETGGRVRLAGDKSMVVTVDGAGVASVWSLLEPQITAFWTRVCKHPTALESAITAFPGFELVLYGSSPSGRQVGSIRW